MEVAAALGRFAARLIDRSFGCGRPRRLSRRRIGLTRVGHRGFGESGHAKAEPGRKGVLRISEHVEGEGIVV
jgi:hypothetical protein